LASIVPHAAFEQPVPVTVQVTVEFGLPALKIRGTNVCAAPSSTLGLAGVTLTATSLVIVAAANPVAVESA
jgi:hypothetical protein